MKKLKSNILILAGIIILISAFSFKLIHFIEENKSKSELESKVQDIKSNNISSKDVYKDIKSGDKLGKISIPSLSIEGVIVEGTENEEIAHNVGHFKDTALPGENGNFSVAGHNSTVYTNVFNNIDKIENGDEILVDALNGSFVYEVVDKFVVEPEETSVLNGYSDKKEITIVTCTSKGKERLIVKGLLK